MATNRTVPPEMTRSNLKTLELLQEVAKELEKITMDYFLTEDMSSGELLPHKSSQSSEEDNAYMQVVSNENFPNQFNNPNNESGGSSSGYGYTSPTEEYVENLFYSQYKQHCHLSNFEFDCMHLMSPEFAEQYFSENNVPSYRDPVLKRREQRHLATMYEDLTTISLVVGRAEAEFHLRKQGTKIWELHRRGVPVFLVTMTEREEVRAELVIAERDSGMNVWRMQLHPEKQ